MAWQKLEGFYGLAGTSEAERQALLDLLPEDGWMLEIGSADGVTAAWLASQRPNATILSVDPYPTPAGVTAESEPVRFNNWWRNRRPNQRLFLGRAEGLKEVAVCGRFHLVVVDGSHEYKPCLRDLNSAAMLLREDGVIAAHDWGRRRTVVKAVLDFCDSHPEWLVARTVGRLAILRRLEIKIIYGCVPHKGLPNVGDHAQAVCIRRWMAKHWPGVEVIEFNKAAPIEALKAAASPEDLVFIHSGGNMGDRGAFSEGVRRKIIRALPDNRIVSLPQTIHFSNTARGRAFLADTKLIYAEHEQLSVLARDPYSYNLALEYFPNAQVGLCPDFVLGCPYEPLGGTIRKGVLLCLRSDNESALGKEGRAALEAFLRERSVEVARTDTTCRRPLTPETREAEMLTTLDLFGRHDCVVTDRLHGLIFAVLARTPCVVLPTVDHKLICSAWWLKGIPAVRFLAPGFYA